jgi:hypothetical protein
MRKFLLLLVIAFISITDQAVGCTNWAVSPSYQQVPCSGGTYSITVTASGSCTFNYTISDNTWISFSSYSSGGVLNYNVTANTTGSARTGYIYINDVTDGISYVATLEIYQDACSGCTNWAVSPSYQQVPPDGGSYSTDVTASGSCTFNYTISDNTWISFTGYGSGGVLNYNITTNTTGYARTGYIYINDVTDGINNVTSLEIYQDACCTNWVVSPSFQQVPPGGGNYSIDVSANGTCTYNYSISDPNWIYFINYGSNGVLNYYVSANTTSYSRTGYIYINDANCSINNVGSLFITQASDVGINEINADSNTIAVYPNPATNNITIDVSATLNMPATIEILNIQGQLIKTIVTNSNKTDIDISAFPSGMYFVKVKTEKRTEVRKFMKE